MTILSPTKTQAKKLYPILEREDATLAEVASDVLQRSFELYEERGKWVALIQPMSMGSDHYSTDDVRRAPIALGIYATEKAAAAAALSAGNEQASVGERYVTWVLPITFQAPVDYRAERKELHEDHSKDRVVDMSWLPELGTRKCGAPFVLPGGRGIARCEKPWPCRGQHSAEMPEKYKKTPEGAWLSQPSIDLEVDIESPE